jgi:uncharacterized protein YutE (UPF0331/DUF86 family)
MTASNLTGRRRIIALRNILIHIAFRNILIHGYTRIDDRVI